MIKANIAAQGLGLVPERADHQVDRPVGRTFLTEDVFAGEIIVIGKQIGLWNIEMPGDTAQVVCRGQTATIEIPVELLTVDANFAAHLRD